MVVVSDEHMKRKCSYWWSYNVSRCELFFISFIYASI